MNELVVNKLEFNVKFDNEPLVPVKELNKVVVPFVFKQIFDVPKPPNNVKPFELPNIR